MKYRRVITMLASASLAISIPVTSLAAEVNLIVPNEIGTSNHADTQVLKNKMRISGLFLYL